MKKGKTIGVTIIVIGLFIAIINFGKSNKDIESEITKEEIYQCVIYDNFSSNTEIEKQLKKEVEITIEQIEKNTVTLKIEAPNIAEALYNWVDSISEEELTEELMEEKIVELVKESSKVMSIYELKYTNTDKIQIQYTEESKNTMSCGMIEFYNMCMERIIEDMETGE